MKSFIAAACAAAVFAAAPSEAATYNRITAQQLVSVLQAAGLSVSSASGQNIFAVGNAFVWLTECDAAGLCAELNFFNNFQDVHPTLQAVNEWNNTKKIPEASINPDGTLHMEMWMSTIGTSDSNIVDTLGWFATFMGDAEFWSSFISRGQA